MDPVILATLVMLVAISSGVVFIATVGLIGLALNVFRLLHEGRP